MNDEQSNTAEQCRTQVKEVVDTWVILRLAGREFTQRDMRKFMEAMNDRTRQMISIFQVTDVGFYEHLAEDSMLAMSMLQGGDWTSNEEASIKIRVMIGRWGRGDINFYSGLMELCVNACTHLTPKARVIADGVDRTDV